jgi:tetratricopeptide (TPR) repeat protein
MAKGELKNPKAVSRYLELLALQQKHEQVLDFISSYRSRTDDDLPPPLQTHFVSAVLAQVRPNSEDDPGLISVDDVELLSTAWQLQPTRSEILHRLVQATYQQDEAAVAAEQIVRSAIASGEQLFTIYSVIGAQAIVHDEYLRAVDALEKARRFDPDNAVVQNNLALALIRSDMPDGDRALQLIDDALKQAPDFVELIATRAEILIQLQRNVAARQELNRVLQRDPEHQLASKLLQDLDTTETR